MTNHPQFEWNEKDADNPEHCQDCGKDLKLDDPTIWTACVGNAGYYVCPECYHVRREKEDKQPVKECDNCSHFYPCEARRKLTEIAALIKTPGNFSADLEQAEKDIASKCQFFKQRTEEDFS
jgi:hypothetical protein